MCPVRLRVSLQDWSQIATTSISWNLQGLNIWNMLIQFYTKFGIGKVSADSKWYKDETS